MKRGLVAVALVVAMGSWVCADDADWLKSLTKLQGQTVVGVFDVDACTDGAKDGFPGTTTIWVSHGKENHRANVNNATLVTPPARGSQVVLFKSFERDPTVDVIVGGKLYSGIDLSHRR